MSATVFDIDVIKSPYTYRDYNGPRNAVLQQLLDTNPDARNLTHATICQHGRVFPLNPILKILGVNFGDLAHDAHEPLVFMNAQDPMTRVTIRARYIKDSYPSSHYLMRQWLFEQYPELQTPVQAWHDAARQAGTHNIIGVVPTDHIDQWLNTHPEYKEGLLIFPRPTLWNRIGEQIHGTSVSTDHLKRSILHEAIAAGREFYIETIAALFVPELAEKYLPELKQLLVHLAGPHSTRLSQVKVVHTIAKWVVTQFPELAELQHNPEWARDADKLSERYGRTLGLIPIEWATGNMKQVQFSPSAGATIDAVPASILRLIRGEDTASERAFAFRLRDPVTGMRHTLHAGDDVRLLFKPKGRIYGDLTHLDQHEIAGTIKSIVVNERGETVGIELCHWITKGYPAQRIGTQLQSRTYWLADCDAEDSVIVANGKSPAQERSLSSYNFPENSGEFMLPLGQSDMQAPISIGDQVTLYTDPKLFHIVDAIVTGFVRDDDGKITGFQAYIDKNYRFQHAMGLVRNEDGTPVAIEHEIRDNSRNVTGVSRTELAGNFDLHNFAWSDINRMPGNSRFTTPSWHEEYTQYFRLPQSPVREPYDQSPFWGHSADRHVAFKQDSGDFMLRIGRGSTFLGDPEGKKVEQAPISPGDEILIRVDKPGSLLGFYYERLLVTSFEFDSTGRATGISGISYGGDNIRTWKVNDIDIDSSYIETNPWFGNRANSIPGAYSKRVQGRRQTARENDPHSDTGPQTFEDIFGYRYGEKIETPAWTDEPLSYDDWLEVNHLAKIHGMEIQWAYWVLQKTPDDSCDSIKKSYRKLSTKFHPDRTGEAGTKVMSYINKAWSLIQALHEKPESDF